MENQIKLASFTSDAYRFNPRPLDCAELLRKAADFLETKHENDELDLFEIDCIFVNLDMGRIQIYYHDNF